MESRRIQSVLLASGGMDSITLAFWLEKREIPFIPLFIDYGQHCSETEFKTLMETLPKESVKYVRKVDVSSIYQNSKSRLIDEANLWQDDIDYKDMYLPYRSLLLLTVGAAFAQTNGCSKLYSGFINSNHAQELDCSAHFFSKLSEILDGYGGVEIEMPFRNMNKFEVAKIGVSLGARIGRTFSCQASSKIPCGACPNCVDRLEALEKISYS